MDKEENVIDLMELFNVFIGKIGYIFLCACIFAAVIFFYTKLAVPSRYTSSVSMYVSNNTYNAGISDSVNISDMNASQKLVDTYKVILQDDVVMDSISEKLSKTYSRAELERYIAYAKNDEGEFVPSSQAIRKCIGFSAVDETEILKVDVTTENPKLSAEICQYVTDVAPETIIRVIGAGAVEPIGKVKIPTQPSGPNVKKNTLIGFIAGFALSLVVVFAFYFLDNTITNADAFKNKINLPVLGEIPNYESDGKGGDKNGK